MEIVLLKQICIMFLLIAVGMLLVKTEFLSERGAWMDQYIEVVQQYGHPSAVKKYNH